MRRLQSDGYYIKYIKFKRLNFYLKFNNVFVLGNFHGSKKWETNNSETIHHTCKLKI